MNFSKLFLMMALGVSLNNSACGMEHEDNKRKHEDNNTEQSQKIKKEYDEAATEELRALLNSILEKVSEEKITELLNAGANPNIKNKSGYTPLYWAAYWGQQEVVQLLLKAGVNPNIKRNNSETPLHEAARNGRKEIVEMLLKAAANQNVQDADGWTPLDRAINYCHKDVFEILLKAAADLKIQDKYGFTPLHRAALRGHKEIVERIINFINNGAQISDNKVTQLTYSCSLNKTFRNKCQIFLMINNRQPRSLKIPKLLCYEFLLRLWNPLQCITELINTKDNNGKTVLDGARERSKKEVVKLLELYEKK